IRRRTPSGSAATSRPATSARPDVIERSVVSILTVVDFPAPFGPRKPNTSPAATSRSTPWTASTLPPRPPYVFTSSVALIAGTPLPPRLCLVSDRSPRRQSSPSRSRRWSAEPIGLSPRSGHPRGMRRSRVQLLVADDDPAARSLIVALASARVDSLGVLEAADGADAVEIGLERRPQIALLDVEMPRLDGIEAALVLRELQPRMALALHTGAPLEHRARAREHGLLLFDKIDPDGAVAWLELQAHL